VLTAELTGGDGLELASPLNDALIERVKKDLTEVSPGMVKDEYDSVGQKKKK
jgi:hypothetical protein